MGLRINNSDIFQIKVDGSNISLAKINGEIIFQFGETTVTITFTDKTIKAVSNKSGSYDFYYAKGNKIIEDYDKIVSFDLKANVTSSYTYMNSFNIAPYEATKIVVCKSGTTKVLDSSPLPSQFKFDSSKFGEKLYSFGALSDVHIDGDGTDEANASSDLIRALTFFNSNSSFVCVSGDLCRVENSGDDELLMYKNLIDNNATIPVYESRGNHDCRYSITNWESYTGGSLYFEQTYQNDKFIFLGMNAEDYGDSCFTTEELDWLETKLESYKNQRVFLFFHVFMPNTCGNINGLYPYSSLNTSSSVISRFIQLMTTYKNVIYFSGHSHLAFNCQKYGANANIFSDGTTCHRVHIPSCAKPRKNDTGTSSSNTYDYNDGSEGYLVDVYENAIVLRGRDFEKGKYLPIANYLIDTTIINIEEDESGNLYPVQEEASYTGDGGLDVTFADKYCLINGTATSWGYYYTHKFVMNLEANKQYKFKLTLDSGSTDATDNIIIVELWENGTGVIDFVWLTTETVYNEITFTPSASNSTYVLFLDSIEGVTYNNWKVNISITEA